MLICIRSTLKFLGCALLLIVVLPLLLSREGQAQIDLRISGPKAGFPVAVPELCDLGGSFPITQQIAKLISKDLDLSGLFKVLDPNTFVETPGKCIAPEQVAYSDWSVIGAEGLVKGQVKTIDGGKIQLDIWLFDVQQQKAVVGKRYEADETDWSRIAHRFANEIMRFFTGEAGVFGTKIAFVSKVGRFKELFVMELDGSGVKQITSDRGLALFPAWSETGNEIVYTSYKTKRPELYTIPAQGGNPQRVTTGGSLKIGAKFMPGGSSLISALSSGGGSNLVIMDLKGGVLRRITRGDWLDVSPSLAPGNNQLAFCSDRGGGPQIYVMDLSGGEAKRISFTGRSYCTSPAWSPKGDKIVYVCQAGGNQLYMSAPDGSNTVQLTFSGNNEDPSWSPDGRMIVYSADHGRGSRRNLYVLSLVSGASKLISPGRDHESQPAWSPRFE